MFQNGEFSTETDHCAQHQRADLTTLLRDIERDRQALRLLCAQQHETILAMRRALVTARCVILRDSDTAFDLVERDLARLKLPLLEAPPPAPRTEIVLPTEFHPMASETPSYDVSRSISKYRHLDEAAWIKSMNLAAWMGNVAWSTCLWLFSLSQNLLSRRTAILARVHVGIYARIGDTPRIKNQAVEREGGRGPVTRFGWANFAYGTIFAIAFGIVVGIVLFDLVN